MSDIHQKIGAQLSGFGGFLRCEECGSKRVLGNIGDKLRNGWPKCCGYTMRWWTRNQLSTEHPEGSS